MIGDVYHGWLRGSHCLMIEQSNGLLLVTRLKDFYYTHAGEPTNDVTHLFGPVLNVSFSHTSVPGQTEFEILDEVQRILVEQGSEW